MKADTQRKKQLLAKAGSLRGRAEDRLRELPKNPRPPGRGGGDADAQRLVHELQVHQIELEMQNRELQEARDRMETLVDKYTDLYDFAPVGYFSLEEPGRIVEVNLTGAALLGVERAWLVNQHLLRFMAPESQPVLEAFLAETMGRAGKQVCEVKVRKPDGTTFWADCYATSAVTLSGPRKRCRVALSDVTELKRAKEAQRRVEELIVTNRQLEREVLRREASERALRKSERHQVRLLQESGRFQEQLRSLSHQILSAQEQERKTISRELHDVIAQTLTGINIQLTKLRTEAGANAPTLEKNISLTQQLVEKSVGIVHQFARELRPTVLDDLGLIPALHTFMKTYTAQTGIRVGLTAFAKVEELDGDKRTVLYRVAQEALTNIARHSHASRAEVKIQKSGDHVNFQIRDNGKGFETGAVRRARSRSDRACAETGRRICAPTRPDRPR